MSNFELVTQNVRTLEEFISAVVDDALEAEGCSLDLKLPDDLQEHGPEDPALSWEEWLKQEAENEAVYLPHGVTIEKWEPRGGADG